MVCLKKSYDGILGEELFFIPPLNHDTTLITDQYKVALTKGSNLLRPFNYKYNLQKILLKIIFMLLHLKII